MALKKKAQQVRAAGSKNSTQDSMLAHISPKEAVLLKAYGGSGRRDPNTGMPHFDDPGIGDPGVSDGIGVPAGGDSDVSGPSDFSGIDFSGVDNQGFASGDMAQVSPNDIDPAVLASMTPDDESTISKMFKGIPATLAKGQITGQIANMLGIPNNPAIGALTGALTGQAPTTPSQALGNFSGIGLAGLGGIFGGPVGAALGGLAGNAIGNSIGAPPSMSAGDISAANAETSNPANSSGTNMQSDFMNSLLSGPGLGALATGLGGMYMGNQSANMYNGAMNQINDLYSPNSPYAQQMRQAMERKDAAAGRRSQYGARETQLAAALSQAHASALSSPGYANMMRGADNAQNQGLRTLISLFNGKAGQGMLGGLGRNMSDWYAQTNNPNYSHEGMNYPSYSGQGLDLGGGGGDYNYGSMETGW